MDPPVVVADPLARVAAAARHRPRVDSTPVPTPEEIEDAVAAILRRYARAQHRPPINRATGAPTPEPTPDAPMDPLPLDPLETS